MVIKDKKHDAEVRELLERSEGLIASAKRLIAKQDKTAAERLAMQKNIHEIAEATRRLIRLSSEPGRSTAD